MKKAYFFALLLAGISISGMAEDMSGMDMKGMDMKGMDMKGMNQSGNKAQTYRTTGVVKKLDKERRRVTIAHQPVEALGWPAMTMTFAVEDRKLLGKLRPGEKIGFEFIKRGNGYLLTGVN